MAKTHDAAINAGEYKDKSGNTKVRWKNVGGLFEKDGKPYLLIDKGVNLAAYATPGRDSVLISLFVPRNDGTKQATTPADQVDDEIPY